MNTLGHKVHLIKTFAARLKIGFAALLLVGFAPLQTFAQVNQSCNPDLEFGITDTPFPIYLGETFRISADLGARDIKDGTAQDITAFGYALNCQPGQNFQNCISEGNTVEFLGNLSTDCKRPDGTDVVLAFPQSNVIPITTIGGPIRTGANQTCNVQFDARIVELAPGGDNIVIQSMGWPIENQPATVCNNGLTSTASSTLAILVESCEIDVKKQVSVDGETWFDADSVGTAPSLPLGGTAYYRLVIENTGSADYVQPISVVDAELSINTTIPALGSGESVILTGDQIPNLTAESRCQVVGSLQNTANIGAMCRSGDSPVNATGQDSAYLVCTGASVDIEKATNGFDADTPTGPSIPVGGAVSWTYVVTNTGELPLSNVVVTDDQGVTVSCPATTLDVGAFMTCTASGTAVAGQYANLGTVNASSDAGPVSDEDPSHYFGTTASIDIEKATNGFDADTPTGPRIAIGGAVTWTYVVTNTGNVTLTGVAVSDDQLGAISCPTTTLAAGASMTCTAQGTAQAGQYANLGTVTGTPPEGPPVDDSDPSHYFGVEAAIDIEKATNGFDADSPAGPQIPVGEPVTWTYVVTNIGNETLTGIAVGDDVLGPISCPTTTLAAGASMTCTAQGTAQAGQYANLGTVTGTPPVGPPVDDSDPSHYFGVDASIDIEKATNGEDADTPTGPQIAIGGAVTWTYVVTNTGNVTLTGVAVSDDQLGAISCPTTTLAAGASMTCTAQGTAEAGQYANLGSVTGNPPVGPPVDDDDPSHYFGTGEQSILILKEISVDGGANWFDANEEGSAVIAVFPSAALYRFTVTNNGNAPLTNVLVNDPELGVTDYAVGDLAISQQVVITSGDIPELSVEERCGDRGTFINIATASAVSAETGDPANDNDPAVLRCIGEPHITILKEISPTGGDPWYDDITPPQEYPSDAWYRLTVTNDGTAPLENVVLTDGDLLVVENIGNLDVGQTLVFESGQIAELYAANRCAGAGEVGNTASVTGNSVDDPNDIVNDSDTATLLCVGEPLIEIIKEVSIDNSTWFDANTEGEAVMAVAPSDAWYRFTVRNVGPVDLTGVTVSDGTLGIFDFAVGDIPIGGEVVLTSGQISELFYADRCTDSGTFANTATATGQSADTGSQTSDADEAWLECTGNPDIQIVKEISVDGGTTWFTNVTPTQFPPSDAWYRLTVRNTGTTDLDNVLVNDVTLGIVDYPVGSLPVGTEVVLGEGEIAALYQQNRCTTSGDYVNTASASGTSVEFPFGGVNDSDSATLVCGEPIDICEEFGRPTVLKIAYNGTSFSDNAQSVVGVPDVVALPATVTFKLYDKNDLEATHTGINVGDPMNILGKWTPSGKIPPNIKVEILDGTTLLQTIIFHGSCSAPLIVGDKFGGFTIIGFTP